MEATAFIAQSLANIYPSSIPTKKETKMENRAARQVFTIIVVLHTEPKVDQTGNDITSDSTIIVPSQDIVARDQIHAHLIAASLIPAKTNLKLVEVKVKGF